MSAEAILENLRRIAAAAAAPLDTARATGPAELARQRISAWLDAHHTPSRAELEALRGALHAASLELGILDDLAKTGLSMAAECQSTLAASAATDQRSNVLLGLLVKFQAAGNQQRTAVGQMREAAASALGAWPKGGKKTPRVPRFKSGGKGAVN